MDFKDIINRSNRINESLTGMSERTLDKNDVPMLLNQIREYGNHSTLMYGDDRLYEVIESLGNMIENMEILTLQETQDWMDKVSVNRDMKSLKDTYKLMTKTAQELRPLKERLSNCYDSIGIIIDRYYEVGNDE